MILVHPMNNPSTQNPREIRARVVSNGRSADVFFRWRGPACGAPGDAVLLAALPLAMQRAEGMRLDVPVSASLLEGLPAVQEALQALDPALSRVEVEATAPVPDASPCGQDRPPAAPAETAALFDGGLESLFCLVRHLPEIKALIVVTDESAPSRQPSPLLRRGPAFARHTAAGLAKETVEVETNAGVLYRRRERPYGFESGLVSLAGGLALSGRFSRLYLPGGLFGLDRGPAGPGSGLKAGGLDLCADGEAAGNQEMAETILASQAVLDTLRVCWENPNRAFNCGRCPACTRRMPFARLLRSLGARTDDGPHGARDDQDI